MPNFARSAASAGVSVVVAAGTAVELGVGVVAATTRPVLGASDVDVTAEVPPQPETNKAAIRAAIGRSPFSPIMKSDYEQKIRLLKSRHASIHGMRVFLS